MIKEIIRTAVNLLGFDIRKYNINNVDSLLISKCLDVLKIDLLMDVGANIGQYGSMIRKGGYTKSIISFEPLASAFKSLKETAAKNKDWRVYNYGVGSTDGEVVINVSENSVSSSLLDVMEASTKVEPSSKFSKTETIKLTSLNKFCKDASITNQNVYLKLDVQGYELEVLKGASEIVAMIKGIQIELSTTTLYMGAPLYVDVIMHLREMGFELYSVIPEFRNPETGRLLQFDGIFIRKDILNIL